MSVPVPDWVWGSLILAVNPVLWTPGRRGALIRAGEGGGACLGAVVYCPPGPGSIVCMALAPGRNSSLDLRRWNGHLTADQTVGAWAIGARETGEGKREAWERGRSLEAGTDGACPPRTPTGVDRNRDGRAGRMKGGTLPRGPRTLQRFSPTPQTPQTPHMRTLRGTPQTPHPRR